MGASGRPTEKSRPLLLDGGLATTLEANGFSLLGGLWSGEILIREPKAVREAHAAFVDAGADIVTTAAYQLHPRSLRARALNVEEVFRLSTEVARKAAGTRARVAASVGPYGAFLADGSEYRGRYGLSVDELRLFHGERLAFLLATAPDFLACETIPDAREAEALALEIASLPEGAPPAWISFTSPDGKHLPDGTPLREAARLVEGVDGILAVGVNCLAPGLALAALNEVMVGCDKRLIVYPNSGESWNAATCTWHGDAEWGQHVDEWLRVNPFAIGGCCRIGPGEIRALRRRLDGN